MSKERNPFRLIGGTDIQMPVQRNHDEPADDVGIVRTRNDVARAIMRHEKARKDYAAAIAWIAAAEAGEIPGAHVETAKQETALLYEEMREAGRQLVTDRPMEPKAIIDWCLYMEKHFSLLPQEIMGQSLALYLLKNVRLSMRRVTKYGKWRGSVTDE